MKSSKPIRVYENVFDCERYFACWTYQGGLPFYEVWMGNVGVTYTKSGDYHYFFSISSGHLLMVLWIWRSLFCVWSSQDFCHFLSINLLMSGFRSVYGIFVFYICAWNASFFFSFVCPFISLYTNEARYPSKNDAIISKKECSTFKTRQVNGVKRRSQTFLTNITINHLHHHYDEKS